jgi:hypothetical protein
MRRLHATLSALLLIAALIALALATVPAAADFETGRAAYRSGDFAAAIDAWRAPAEGGAPAAQFALGTLYVTGEGVEQDFAEAAYNLGVLNFNGEGVVEDHSAAALLYQQASEKGHIEAQNNLAGMYALGLGIAQDLVPPTCGPPWRSMKTPISRRKTATA